MFCKYCGREISEITSFCPECGKQLKKADEKESVSGEIGAPFILLMLLLCCNTIYSFVVSVSFLSNDIGSMLLSMLALVAGLVVVGIGISTKKIDPSLYRFSDAVPLIFAHIIVPVLNNVLGVYFVQAYGTYTTQAVVIYLNSVSSALQMLNFWMALGVALLGAVRTRHRWSSKIFLVPLITVPVGFLLSRAVVLSIEFPIEVLDETLRLTRVGSLFVWLWPLAVLKVFCALGDGHIGTAGAAVAFLAMTVGEILLLPLTINWLSLGVVGFAVAHGLAPLFTLLALFIVERLHEKKQRKNQNNETAEM